MLLYSISDRNSAFHAYLRTPTPDTKRRYQQARAAAQYEVRRAKSAWIADMCSNVNEGWFGSSDGGKRAWDTIKILKAGLTPPRRPPQSKMKGRDGSIASSPEEIAEVFHQHFTDLYGRTPQWDPTVLDDMPQIPVSHFHLMMGCQATMRSAGQSRSFMAQDPAIQVCMQGSGKPWNWEVELLA